MRAILTKVVNDVLRQRAQTLVVLVVALLGSAVGTAALNLEAQSVSAYDDAFDTQHGAHLVAFFDPRLADTGALASTAQTVGAAASAGPWQQATAVFRRGSDRYTLEVVGRGDPGGDVGVLDVVSGRWANAPGEIVVSRSFAELNGLDLGDQLSTTGVGGLVTLDVVGEAVDVEEGPAQNASQFGWVTPDQVPALDQGTGLVLRMDYRFSSAPSSADLNQALDRLRAGIPTGALQSSYTYLEIRSAVSGTNTLVLSVLLAFTIVALLAAAIIVANSVSGIVISAYHEIGVMKAIGFTPRQVTVSVVGQLLTPAFVACVVGIPLGYLASLPLIEGSARSIGLVATPRIVPAVGVIALLGTLVIVVVAAALPALRAGALSVVEAIRLGTSPSGSKGSGAGRLLSRTRLPRTLTLGLQESLVRPFRSARTVVALLVGVATVTFAYGLNSTLAAYDRETSPSSTYQAVVSRVGQMSDADVKALLSGDSDVDTAVPAATTYVSVPGLAEPVLTTAFEGDPRSVGLRLIQGRWFSGSGEAVTQAGLLKDAGLSVGDTVNASIGTKSVPLHLVGEDFSNVNSGHVLRIDLSTLQQLSPDASPNTYYVRLKPGVDVNGWAQRVDTAHSDALSVIVNTSSTNSPVAILRRVALLLALILSVIAIVGVFNTTFLNTRERAHDLAILKVLGLGPAGVIAMVASSAAYLGLVAGVIGVPVGIWLHEAILHYVGSLLGNTLPPEAYDVFTPSALPVLAVFGIVLGLLGSFVPARWAATSPVAAVLRSE